MGISLITTVRNEEHSIVEFLSSIRRQTRQPEEIIIVDGCSTDRTVDLIRAFEGLPVTCIVEACNIAKGRNIAIRAATQDKIAVTDAGCVLHEDWLECITEFDDDIDMVCGNYKPIIRNLFDACQHSLHGLLVSDKDLSSFVVSSRSIAFRKNVWAKVGGYPEALNYSEDMYFHTQIKKAGFHCRMAMDAIVEWEQRPTVRAVWRQFFLYMEGDGMARMHTKRHVLRFATYLIGLLLLILGLYNPLYMIPLVVGLGGYLLLPYSSFRKLGTHPLLGGGLLLIPILLMIVDTAKMAGYISGLMKPIHRAEHPGCPSDSMVE